MHSGQGQPDTPEKKREDTCLGHLMVEIPTKKERKSLEVSGAPRSSIRGRRWRLACLLVG